MAVYDTIEHRMVCPHCGVIESFDIDVRFNNANLKIYHLGQLITEENNLLNNSNFEIEGYTVCPNCEKDFFVKVKILEKKIMSIEFDNSLKGYL